MENQLDLPVTEGKKMPMRMVKVVVMSAHTWLYALPLRFSMTSGLAFLDMAMYWPYSKKLLSMLSVDIIYLQ